MLRDGLPVPLISVRRQPAPRPRFRRRGGCPHRFRAPPTTMGFRWYHFPMEAVIDQAGRIVLPKPIRDALGLLPGTKVDISRYGAGAQIVPAGRTARLAEEDGVLVAVGETPVDDSVVFALIDAGRT
jgi:AbrB family looped-hinge helix DNA binding protein